MKRVSLMGFLGVAVFVTAVAGGLQLIIPSSRLVLLLAFGIYSVAFLILASPRCGRSVLWGLVLSSIFILLLFGGVLTILCAVAALLWAIRSISSYSSVLAAGCDLLLTATALFIFAWVMLATHSLVLALWSFLLILSLSAFIPTKFILRSDTSSREPIDEFDRSAKIAERALRRMMHRA